jgi:hypothetical protein
MGEGVPSDFSLRVYTAEPVAFEAFSKCGLLPVLLFLGFSPGMQHFKGKSSILACNPRLFQKVIFP